MFWKYFKLEEQTHAAWFSLSLPLVYRHLLGLSIHLSPMGLSRIRLVLTVYVSLYQTEKNIKNLSLTARLNASPLSSKMYFCLHVWNGILFADKQLTTAKCVWRGLEELNLQWASVIALEIWVFREWSKGPTGGGENISLARKTGAHQWQPHPPWPLSKKWQQRQHVSFIGHLLCPRHCTTCFCALAHVALLPTLW